MKKLLRVLGVLFIIAAIAGLIYYLYNYIRAAQKNISFKGFFVSRVDLKGVNLADLLTTGVTNAVIGLGIRIENTNDFKITFKSINIKLFYQGVMVAETSNELESQRFVLPANGSLLLAGDANVMINKQAYDFLYNGLTGTHPAAECVIRITIFGIPLRFTEQIKW